MRPRRRRAGAVLLTALLAMLVTAVPTPAQPERDQPAGPSVGLVITELEAVLGPGTAPTDAEPASDLRFRALVENRGSAPLTNLVLVTVVHPPVTTRSGLRQALDRGQPQGFLTSTDVAASGGAPLQPGQVVGLEVEIPGTSVGWQDQDAIYPVRIAVRRGLEVLDEVTTAAIHLSTTPAPDLSDQPGTSPGVVGAVFVWPVSTPPWRGPDGTYPPRVDEEIRPGGRLDRLVAALEANPRAPVALVPPVHLIEDLRDRADGFVRTTADRPERIGPDAPQARLAARFLERLQDLVDQLPQPVLAGPYADADIAALADGPDPLPDLAAEAVRDGRARLRSLTGADPAGAIYLADDTLDRDALELIPAEHLLLPWTAVEGPDLASDPDLPVPLRAIATPSGRRLSAMVSDPYVSDLVAAPATHHGNPVAVQRVLAETAMVHLERPSRVRPLLILPALDWDPDPQVLPRLLRALEDAPWVALTSPTQQLAATAQRSVAANLAPTEETLGAPLLEELRKAAVELDALLASLPEDVHDVDGRDPGDLTDQLVRAASVWFHGGEAGRAAALVADVQGQLDRRFGAVTVPVSAQVTLTSERGALPVTLQRGEGGPLDVLVTISSRGNLRWPQRSQTVSLTGPGTQTVSFDTIALGRGTFTVNVRVWDTTRTRLLDQATLSVRSTAISRPALIATAGAILGLLAWGALRRRRPRRPKLEVVRDPVAAGGEQRDAEGRR